MKSPTRALQLLAADPERRVQLSAVQRRVSSREMTYWSRDFDGLAITFLSSTLKLSWISVECNTRSNGVENDKMHEWRALLLKLALLAALRPWDFCPLPLQCCVFLLPPMSEVEVLKRSSPKDPSERTRSYILPFSANSLSHHILPHFVRTYSIYYQFLLIRAPVESPVKSSNPYPDPPQSQPPSSSPLKLANEGVGVYW